METCESDGSVLIMGRRKSNEPLDVESRGSRTKFDMKKHGAWSSTGMERLPGDDQELELASADGVINAYESSELPSSSEPPEKIIWWSF